MKKIYIFIVILLFIFFYCNNIKSQLYVYATTDIDTELNETTDELYKVYIEEGLNYLELEDYEKAKSSFWKAAEKNPQSPDAYINLGIIHLRENNLERAMELFSEAEKRTDLNYSKKEILYYNLGLSYFLNNDYKKAAEYFQNALNIHPNFGEALYYLGKCLDALGNADEALINIIKARNIFARKNQADYYQKANEAFSLLNSKYNRDSSTIANNLIKEGSEALKNGNIALATNLFEESISFDEKNANAYYKLALIYIKEGSLSKGLDFLKKANKLDADFVDVNLCIGEIYVKLKRYQEALDIFNKIISKDKNNARALYDLGFLYSELGNNSKAEEYFKQARMLSREDINSLLGENFDRKVKKQESPKEESKKFYISHISTQRNKGVFQRGYYVSDSTSNISNLVK